MFGNKPDRLNLRDGRSLADVCISLGAAQSAGNSATIFEFPNGSAVLLNRDTDGDWWEYRAEFCRADCPAEVGCECGGDGDAPDTNGT
jgi:hypothetical protein